MFVASEHKTSQLLAIHGSPPSLYNYASPITHKALFAISNELFKHKQTIDQFLYGRLTDLFYLEDKLVIFDISDTYFETGKTASKLAKYG